MYTLVDFTLGKGWAIFDVVQEDDSSNFIHTLRRECGTDARGDDGIICLFFPFIFNYYCLVAK